MHRFLEWVDWQRIQLTLVISNSPRDRKFWFGITAVWDIRSWNFRNLSQNESKSAQNLVYSSSSLRYQCLRERESVVLWQVNGLSHTPTFWNIHNKRTQVLFYLWWPPYMRLWGGGGWGSKILYTPLYSFYSSLPSIWYATWPCSYKMDIWPLARRSHQNSK